MNDRIRSCLGRRLALLLGGVGLLISASLYYYMGHQASLMSFGPLLSAYIGLFLIFFAAWIVLPPKVHWGWIIAVGLLLRLTLLTSLPELSEDYHRFLWDGEVVAQGGNPYDLAPANLHADGGFDIDEALLERMNSENFISVYPPLLQGIFGLAAWIYPNDFVGAVMVIRLFIIGVETGTMLLLVPLLRACGKGSRALVLYAWNPFIVLELTGNLHFEGVMIFFLLLFVYWAQRGWLYRAAGALAFAVGAKILPLIVLPLILRRWGLRRFVLMSAVVLAINGLLWAPFWFAELPQRYFSSLRLYFSYFEFNASFYYMFIWLGESIGIGESRLDHLGRILSVFSAGLIVVYSLGARTVQSKPLAFSLLVIWSIYYFFSPVVHPWYVATSIPLALLAGFKFPLVWAVFLPSTYVTYARDPFYESIWIVQVQYAVVFAFLLWESKVWIRPWQRFKIFIARRKLNLLTGILKPGETVLEVGAGNGALAKLLGEHGFQVRALDVRDRSLFPEVAVETYDGAVIPYADHSHDTVQLITVLHHVRDPEALLRESKRVGRRLVVMEDVYSTRWQKYLTWGADSLANAEFFGHPHSNKTDPEWRRLFQHLGLKMVETREFRFLGLFTQIVYVLEVGE